MIRSAVLIQYTRVTDRRPDGRTDGIGVAYTRYSIYAVARKNAIEAATVMRRRQLRSIAVAAQDSAAEHCDGSRLRG